MFNMADKIVRYIEDDMDGLLYLILGSSTDQYGDSYIGEYKEVIDGFMIKIKDVLSRLEKNNVFLGYQEIYNSILLSWDSEIKNKNYLEKLNSYVNEILVNVYCDKVYLEEADKESELNSKEMNMVMRLISKDIESTSTSLFELATDGSTAIVYDIIRKSSEEQYNKILKSEVSRYIELINLKHKLTKENPITDDVSHDVICEYFNINKNKFNFSS